jgi:antirestriction protein
MIKTNINIPAIYVGTYGKYNSGSIAGKWLSLDEYNTEEKFYDAARKLHKNEHDPELMFQDFENFPTEFYGESGCDSRLWEWLALDKDQREIVAAWLDQVGGTDSIEYILDCHIGSADSWSDFVADYADNTGDLDSIPDHLQGYFDYEAYGRDLRHSYTVADTSNGVLVFANC